MSLFGSTSSSPTKQNVFILEKSDKKNFQWKVECPSGKIIYFGDANKKNFTMTKKTADRFAYVRNHDKEWNPEEIETSEFWERWLLYNKKSVCHSIDDTCSRFNIKIECKNLGRKKHLTMPKTLRRFDSKLVNEIISL